jgi:hypothetical protein
LFKYDFADQTEQNTTTKKITHNYWINLKMFKRTIPLYKHVVSFPRYKFYDHYQLLVHHPQQLQVGQTIQMGQYIARLRVDDVDVRVDVVSQVNGIVVKVYGQNEKTYASGQPMYDIDDGKGDVTSFHDWKDDWSVSLQSLYHKQ